MDRLLASPRYGERWGRHWLDVARYADSGGYESDTDRPTAYHYRDFVIQALNDDMPFDEFVRRQLAGDEIDPDDPRAVAATGFLAAGPSADPARQAPRGGTAAAAVHRTGRHGHHHRRGPARADASAAPAATTTSSTRSRRGTTTACSPPCTPGTGPRCRSGPGPRSNGRPRAQAEWDKQRKAAETRLKEWLDGQKKALGPRLRRRQKIDRLPIARRGEGPAPATSPTRRRRRRSRRSTRRRWRSPTPTGGSRDGRRGPPAVGRTRRRARGASGSREPKAPPVALAFRDFGPKPAASWLFRRGDFHDRTHPGRAGLLDRADPRQAGGRLLEGGPRRRRPGRHHLPAAGPGGVGHRRRPRGRAAARPRHREPGLAAPLRGGAGPHAERLRGPRRPAVAPGVAGMAGRRPRRPRLEAQAAAPDDPAECRLPTGRTFDPAKAKADPDNRLLWRMRPRRLEAEALRDAMLAVERDAEPGDVRPGVQGPDPGRRDGRPQPQEPVPEGRPGRPGGPPAERVPVPQAGHPATRCSRRSTPRTPSSAPAGGTSPPSPRRPWPCSTTRSSAPGPATSRTGC